MESRLHSTPRGEKRQTAQAYGNGGGFGENAFEGEEAQVRGAVRAAGWYWIANRRGACVALNRFRARLPSAPRPPQPLAWEGTGAKNVKRRTRRGHSRGSRKRTWRLHLRRQWLSLRNSARRTLTAAKRLARPSQRQMRGLPRFSALSSNVAPKERCPKGPGTLLDGPRTRGSR